MSVFLFRPVRLDYVIIKGSREAYSTQPFFEEPNLLFNYTPVFIVVYVKIAIHNSNILGFCVVAYNYPVILSVSWKNHLHDSCTLVVSILCDYIGKRADMVFNALFV